MGRQAKLKGEKAPKRVAGRKRGGEKTVKNPMKNGWEKRKKERRENSQKKRSKKRRSAASEGLGEGIRAGGGHTEKKM